MPQLLSPVGQSFQPVPTELKSKLDQGTGFGDNFASDTFHIRHFRPFFDHDKALAHRVPRAARVDCLGKRTKMPANTVLAHRLVCLLSRESRVRVAAGAPFLASVRPKFMPAKFWRPPKSPATSASIRIISNERSCCARYRLSDGGAANSPCRAAFPGCRFAGLSSPAVFVPREATTSQSSPSLRHYCARRNPGTPIRIPCYLRGNQP
jgi:hypothetical protein